VSREKCERSRDGFTKVLEMKVVLEEVIKRKIPCEVRQHVARHSYRQIFEK